jgi:hypothetical protein
MSPEEREKIMGAFMNCSRKKRTRSYNCNMQRQNCLSNSPCDNYFRSIA